MKKSQKIVSKIIFMAGFLTLSILWFVAPLAQAHLLKTDGTIGAVLHIDPEDDPIAGAPSFFFFEFKDKANQFRPELCDCDVSISENNAIISNQPLFQTSNTPSLNQASFSYTFPKKNVYQITVNGKPYRNGDFQPFTLRYDVRVAKVADEATSNSSSSTKDWFSRHGILVIGGMIIVIIAGFLSSRRFRPTRKR